MNRSCRTCKGDAKDHSASHNIDVNIERKIGCDKSQPVCQNCARTNRICKGYSLQLSWPGDGDRRRASTSYCKVPAQIYDSEPGCADALQYKPVAFLNSTIEDISTYHGLYRKEVLAQNLNFKPTILVEPSLQYILGTNQEESDLLAYYSLKLSRIITTIDDKNNGFRTILLRLSASGTHLGPKSVRDAILALSACHLYGKHSGLKYKVRAFRSLQQSFQVTTTDDETKIYQLTACMMLCVVDVFDCIDGSWHVHLQAARALRSHLQPTSGSYDVLNFLSGWLAYHDVLSAFSYGPLCKSIDHDLNYFTSAPDASSQNILGALGCSSELLTIISSINRLNQSLSQAQLQTDEHAPQILAQITMLSRRLHGLNQEFKIQHCEGATANNYSRVVHTAELYRLAAILYLHRVLARSRTMFPGHSHNDTEWNLQVPASHPCRVKDDMLSLLDMKLSLCTSPWPVFVLACEFRVHSCQTLQVRVDGTPETSERNHSDLHEGRRRVLKVIDKMQRERRIGNIDVMREIIEGIWKYSDLTADDRRGSRHGDPDFDVYDWRKIVNLRGGLPSFI